MLVAVISWAIANYQPLPPINHWQARLYMYNVYEPFHLKRSQLGGGVVGSPHISSLSTKSWLMKEGPTKHIIFTTSCHLALPQKHMTTTSHPRCHPSAILSDRPMHQPYRTTGTVTEVLALVPIPERLLEHKVLLELPHPRHSAKLPQNEWPHRETRWIFVVNWGKIQWKMGRFQ